MRPSKFVRFDATRAAGFGVSLHRLQGFMRGELFRVQSGGMLCNLAQLGGKQLPNAPFFIDRLPRRNLHQLFTLHTPRP